MSFQIVTTSQLAKISGLSMSAFKKQVKNGLFHGKLHHGASPQYAYVFELCEVRWWFDRLGYDTVERPWAKRKYSEILH